MDELQMDESQMPEKQIELSHVDDPCPAAQPGGEGTGSQKEKKPARRSPKPRVLDDPLEYEG
jgi:hypothetical protein